MNPAFFEDVNKHPFAYYSNIRPTNDQTSLDFSAKLDHELSDSLKLVGWALYSDVDQDLVADGTSADFARFLGAGKDPITLAQSGVAAFAFPVFNIDKLASVNPTFSESSFKVIFRLAIITSKFTIIAIG